MARIAGGFILPHEPGIFHAPPERWSEGQRRVRAAYEHIARRIGELRATTAIIIGADHYVLFGPGCLPAYLIGTGDISGPYERFPGIDQGAILDHRGLARHIAQHGREHGFDWAVAKSLRVDHSIGVPARLCALPNASVTGVVPVYLASGVEPLLPMRRAHALGGAIRAAVEAWPGDERVVVIGSGGISHWVGLPEMGRVNEKFDRFVLDCVERGDPEPIMKLSDAEVFEQGGNGAFEIRNFLCMMGALPGRPGELIAYENGPEWVTGLGFAEVREAA
ncbi:protocatechuate 3,4-dioxygenase [Ramlibacter sp. AW1]|uniref:Protocatechuate 3,4-dioxygenase n=1 Tax=Ramlibacter aurantiacus TaxID=2801330 RepID=A0A937D4M2_9BURK|nr:protocatechuate 3,4-dioxygenase [Ramlibacter aurantiacus]MBL0421865.1 protocatechuate 3,4-dioxygenase [Ramlibacter aurantiacus]